MKKLAMLLGCGLMAFAIGCTPETPPPSPPIPSPNEMAQESAGGGVLPPPAGETPAADPAAEKKDDAATEKKDDAATEKKDDPATEKKE